MIQKRTEQRLSYTVKMAGFAAQTNFNMVRCITKVKSHCTKEQVTELGQELHHRGNDHADSMVARARPTHEKDQIEAYVLKRRTRHSLIMKVVNHAALARWRVKNPEKPKKEKQLPANRTRRKHI